MVDSTLLINTAEGPPIRIATDLTAGVHTLKTTGGGGGAVTVADGADVAQGAVADAAVTNPASSGSVIALLKGLLTKLALMVFGAGTAAAAQRTTLASDDPAVATLGATSGAAVITDANGTIQQYLRGLIKQWIAGTLVIGAGTAKIGTVGTVFRIVTGSTLTRPANTTAYTAGDSISDNATAGSVTANTIAFSDTNDDPVTLERCRIYTTDTGIAAQKRVTILFFNSDPTASSGVGAGDNATYSNKQAGFVGSMTGIFRAFSDGGVAECVPDAGGRIVCLPGTGVKTLWYQLIAPDAFTPSANSTTFIPRVEGFQGRA